MKAVGKGMMFTWIFFKTYEELSKGDYISNLVEEEKLRREKAAKKGNRKI